MDNYCQPELKNPIEEIKSENNKDQNNDNVAPTIKQVSYKIDSFFSTEKPSTYPEDTFLADKFDLTNYETTDDVAKNTNDEFANSFETDFW